MAFIGKIEGKEGKSATILVKKTAPCGDNCKSCSAGCKLYNTHIQTDVDDDINEGDYVEISSESDVVLSNSIMHALPVILIIISVIAVQLLPFVQNREIASALAVLLSLIVSQFILKFYDKKKMKSNTRLFKIGKKVI
ncbi:MAG: SoxR reducing system RseC family protein [Sedimentibacter sp.]